MTAPLPTFTIAELEPLLELSVGAMTADDAVDLGLATIALIRERDLNLAVDVTLRGHSMFRAKLKNTGPDNDFWLDAKARTAQRYYVPSLLVGLRARRNGGRMEDNPMFDATTHAAHGGSFPLYIRGVGPVATVTVSGLPQLEDHRLVVEALRTFHAADGL